MNEVDVLILCGGQGKRLRSITGPVPKVMAPVNGRPFLDYHIEFLAKKGFGRIILCTGYQAKAVEDYYREKNFGIVIDFARELEPLGTAGAVKNAEEIVTNTPFVVINGDSFCPLDIKKLVWFHKEKKAIATVAIAKAADASDYGSIVLDRSKMIREFVEKEVSSGGYVNAGVYCFNKKVFKLIAKNKKVSLEYEVFPKLIGAKLFGYPVKEKFYDIGTPVRYQKAKRELAK